MTEPHPANDYAPLCFGARWRLVPPGTPPAAGRVDLVLERGAFGSGEHETTAGCLALLGEQPELAGARVLDFGSGTGVLALAALKLGAARALCVDTAPEAIAVSERNAAHNGLAARVDHRCGTLAAVAESDFDLVLANIYADILLTEAPALVRRTRGRAGCCSCRACSGRTTFRSRTPTSGWAVASSAACSTRSTRRC